MNSFKFKKNIKIILLTFVSIFIIFLVISILNTESGFFGNQMDFDFSAVFDEKVEKIKHNNGDNNNFKKKGSLKRKVSCFLEPSTEKSIGDLNESEITGEDNIFFFETSCSEDGRLHLNPRELCAVESTARMNPKMKIYLLVLNPRLYSNYTASLVKNLDGYKNIFIRRVLIGSLIKNTPLESWWRSEAFDSSDFPTQHISDIARYIILWKFIGIYMDLDIVTLGSFEKLRNCVGLDDWKLVGSGILGFGKDEISREIASATLRDLKKNFKGNVYTQNGPQVITRVLQRICETENLVDMTKNCDGFTVFSPSKFYAIPWAERIKFFNPKFKDEVLKRVNHSAVIHVWGRQSYLIPVKVGIPTAYGIIANQYCPRIYNNCGDWF